MIWAPFVIDMAIFWGSVIAGAVSYCYEYGCWA